MKRITENWTTQEIEDAAMNSDQPLEQIAALLGIPVRLVPMNANDPTAVYIALEAPADALWAFTWEPGNVQRKLGDVISCRAYAK